MVEIEADVEIFGFNGQEIIQGVFELVRIKRSKSLKERCYFSFIEDFLGDAFTKDVQKICECLGV